MRTYATVRGTFWIRGSGKKLRGNPEAQVLAMYLMTCCQGTLCGLFSIALPTIAHETGLPIERLPELFEAIGEIAKYDPEEELCWVPNAAREQIGEKLAPKDKRRAGLLRELKQFEGHRFHREFIQLYWEAYSLEKPSPSQGVTVDDVCPLEGASKGEPLSLPTPGLGQGQGLGPDQVRGGAGGEPDDRPGPCPPDLDLLEAQKANLEMAGAKRWQVDAMVLEIRTKLLGRPERRTLDGWRNYLAGAVTRRWSNPAERPKEPPPKGPADDPNRKMAAEALKRHRRRIREQNQRILEQGIPGLKTPTEAL